MAKQITFTATAYDPTNIRRLCLYRKDAEDENSEARAEVDFEVSDGTTTRNRRRSIALADAGLTQAEKDAITSAAVKIAAQAITEYDADPNDV